METNGKINVGVILIQWVIIVCMIIALADARNELRQCNADFWSLTESSGVAAKLHEEQRRVYEMLLNP